MMENSVLQGDFAEGLCGTSLTQMGHSERLWDLFILIRHIKRTPWVLLKTFFFLQLRVFILRKKLNVVGPRKSFSPNHCC